MNIRFPGQWFQLEAGLAYNWHRHYDATLGRYVQPDPLGLKALMSDGPSGYGYVGGNPLAYVDPDGLNWQINVGLSGTAALWFLGASGSTTVGLSIPDNPLEFDCYQLFGQLQANGMVGAGAYAGFGATAGVSHSDGPLPPGFRIFWAGISKEILVPDRRGVGVFKATTTEYLAVVSALCLESVLVLDCGLVEAGLPASLGQHLLAHCACKKS